MSDTERASTSTEQTPTTCGAQDWTYGEADEVILYGTCQKPVGHEERWHKEIRDGKVCAEWSGPSTERAPTA